jgi:formate dehydrogenase iron-sulfur subunit
VQALHACRLLGRLPHRLAVPDRVRHGRRAGRHLQRLRLLRPSLPLRSDRATGGARSGRCHVNAVGIAQKCTLCYDRLLDDHEPACARACPTDSIQSGDLDELRERAQRRLDKLVEAGQDSAQLYGHDSGDGVGGAGAFFLLLDEPEVYGLPPDPVVPTRDLPEMWRRAGLAALGLLAGTIAIFSAGRRP